MDKFRRVEFAIDFFDIVDAAEELIGEEGDGHFHAAVEVGDDRAENRGCIQSADGGHFRQVLVGLGDTVLARRVQKRIARFAFVVRDHLFAAAGIACDGEACQFGVCGNIFRLDERRDERDETAGMAARIRDAAGGGDFFTLAGQFGEAVGPCGIDAVGGGCVDDGGVAFDHRDGFDGGGVRQAEEGDVGAVNGVMAGVWIFAQFVRKDDEFDVFAGGETFMDAEACRACAAVDENFHGDSFILYGKKKISRRLRVTVRTAWR